MKQVPKPDLVTYSPPALPTLGGQMMFAVAKFKVTGDDGLLQKFVRLVPKFYRQLGRGKFPAG